MPADLFLNVPGRMLFSSSNIQSCSLIFVQYCGCNTYKEKCMIGGGAFWGLYKVQLSFQMKAAECTVTVV